ncbi:competence/damage-inducible protein A [Planctomycetota bacterium]|nr:competence/damage-inducible protein A [Planctomycetota bacterium]
MKASIISIGDELVLGQTVDTNSAWLSGELAKIGVKVGMHLTVEDEVGAIREVIEAMCERSCVVLISGGLGPTDDDLTRQALAKALGVELVKDGEMLGSVKEYFTEKLEREMPERNVVQAMKPVGSEMIENGCGTAPGIKAELDGAVIYVMPGVPSEMRTMFKEKIEPELLDMGGMQRVIRTCKVNTFGMGESDVAETLGELMARDRNPVVGTTVSQGICSVRVRAEFDEVDEADQELEATTKAVEEKMGTVVFGRDGVTLQKTVVEELKKQGKILATAESCTGGMIGEMVTSVSGSSSVYAGGFVTYSNEMKEALLKVPHELLVEHGAVSREVVKAMAEGAVHETGADYGIGVTGIAGPDGGTDEKPVGTVWMGIAKKNNTGETTCITGLLRLSGSRERIRDRAAKCCLQGLRFMLLNEPMNNLRWARDLESHDAG